MIAFFRRIRKTLIQSSSTRKYILYALGEILLVMIGILLALQVNNWNENIKRKATENVLLSQLNKDLKNGLVDVHTNIGIHEKVRYSSRIILNHIDQDLPYHDSLSIHFASSFLWSRLIIDMGAYETIKSHGVEIISNNELRDRIVHLFEGRLFFLRELERLVIDYNEKMRHTDFALYFKSTYDDFGPNESGFSYGRSYPLDFESLKNDQTFRYHLLSFRNISHTLQVVGNRPYRKNIEELISLIEDELKVMAL